jgi:hypothetical protein
VSARYVEDLDLLGRVRLWVDFKTVRGEVTNYVVVLLLATPNGTETIRVFDGSHGYNEMHRHTRSGGKQTGMRFHSGSLGEGLQAAIENAKRNHLQMIEGWSQ